MPFDDPSVLRAVVLLAESEPAEGDRTRWHTILTTGTRKGRPAAGPSTVTFTRKDLQGYCDSFDGEAPVDLHHASMMAQLEGDPRYLDPELSGARGWIKALRCVGDKLEALIDWTEDGADLIKSQAFKYFSVEIGRKGDKPATVTGGTLTNRPFWNLPALAFSDAAANEIEDLNADAGGAESSDGPATPEPDPVPVRDEDHTSHTEETPMSDEMKALQDRIAALEAENADLKGAAGETTALSEKLATVETAREALTDQVKALAERLDTAEKRASDLEWADARDRVLLGEGRIENNDETLAKWRTLFDSDRDTFNALADTLPKGGAVPVHRSTGKDTPDNDNRNADPESEFVALVQKHMNDGKDWDVAERAARDEKPEVWAAFQRSTDADMASRFGAREEV